MTVTATNIANLLNGVGGLSISGAEGITHYRIGAQTYLYVNALYSDTVSVFELDAAGVPVLVQTVADDGNGNPVLDATFGGRIVEVDDKVFYLGTSQGRDSISVFEVGGNGQLTFVSETMDDIDLKLNGTNNDTASITMNDTTYIYASGVDDDGLSIFSLDANGNLSSYDNIHNVGNLNLDGASNVHIVKTGGTNFLVTTAAFGGLSVFEIEFGGNLSNVFNLDDATETLLASNYFLTTLEVGGSTFLYVAGYSENGISIFQMNPDGSLDFIENVVDTPTLELTATYDLQTVEIGGTQYLAASGQIDDGYSFFRVADDGTLTEIFSVQDGLDGAQLKASSNMTFVEIDGVPHLYITSQISSSVTVYRLNFPIAVSYNGSTYEMAETLAGAVEMAEAGSTISVVDDTLHSANDEIVHVTRDNITVDFGVGLQFFQTFHLDDFAFNFDVTGLSGTVRIFGSSQNGETITSSLINGNISTFYGRGGDDTIISGATDDDLFGGHGNDMMYGGGGSDYNFGGSGDDSIFGGSGSDSLVGSQGTDFLDGGNLNDTMFGGLGTDELIGGSGFDLMHGEDGADSMNGNGGFDDLYGGTGADVLRGGGGGDELFGGNANDMLFGGGGDDALFGDNGQDTMEGGKGRDSLYGGDDKDTLIGNGDRDTLIGGDNNDELFGGGGIDTLNGGSGDDTMKGGSGADEFLFDVGNDLDLITDFANNADSLGIALADFGFADVQSMMDALASDVSGDAVIDFGTDGMIVVQGITVNQLTNDVFDTTVL